MNEYTKLDHDYVCDYSLMLSFTWVLTMRSIMAIIFSKAEFAEINVTFAASLVLMLHNLYVVATFKSEALHFVSNSQLLKCLYYSMNG